MEQTRRKIQSRLSRRLAFTLDQSLGLSLMLMQRRIKA
jgi:hypothetical protein